MTVTAYAMQESDFDADMVATAQGEDSVLIYSSQPQASWQGAIDAFKDIFPWAEIEVLEYSTAEVFSRYNIERSSGAKTADMLAANLLPAWITLDGEEGVVDLDLELNPAYPDWVERFDGIYTFSFNPQVIAYNKLLLDEALWPDSMQDIAELVTSDPARFDGKLTTYTPENVYGSQLFYSWARGYNGDAWELLETIIPPTREESSGGTMFAKISAGEYEIGYFLSGGSVLRNMSEGVERVIGWTVPMDGVPIGPTSAAVVKTADSPATASLFLEFVMSEAGQAALPLGGYFPLLGDMPEDNSYFTLQGLIDEVGADNVILTGAAEDEADAVAEFVERWFSVE